LCLVGLRGRDCTFESKVLAISFYRIIVSDCFMQLKDWPKKAKLTLIIGVIIIGILAFLTNNPLTGPYLTIFSGFLVLILILFFMLHSQQKQDKKEEDNLQDLLFNRFTNWKNWAVLLFMLYLYLALRLIVNVGEVSLNGIFISLIQAFLFIFFVGVGILYYVNIETVPIHLQQILMPALMFAFWPIVLSSLFLILKKKLNKRKTIILSIIIILLLLTSFHGCAVLPTSGNF
jgi:hypothetical protein